VNPDFNSSTFTNPDIDKDKCETMGFSYGSIDKSYILGKEIGAGKYGVVRTA
jgi:hypothetical protein